ncbi:MAG: hypothetical protein OEW77_02225 [Gemmatimonadota bacterium]|nr:hypothetical protein [Gemmatimonadota bacterium]
MRVLGVVGALASVACAKPALSRSAPPAEAIVEADARGLIRLREYTRLDREHQLGAQAIIADMRTRGEEPEGYFVRIRADADPDLQLFELYHFRGLMADRRDAVGNASGKDMLVTYSRRLRAVTVRLVWK